MPNATFYAGRFLDPAYKKTADVFPVDPANRESVLEAVDAIRHSNQTPDQVTGMLSRVLANCGSLFTEEEKAQVFGNVAASESTDPFVIELTDENWHFLLNYWAGEDGKVEWTYTVAEADTSDKDARITELTAKLSESEGEVTKLKALAEQAPAQVIAESVAPIDIDAIVAENTAAKDRKITELEGTVSERDQVIANLMTQVADLRAGAHTSLAREAAYLAIQLAKPVAKGKSLDEVTEVLSARLEESLSDMISDLTLELGAPSEKAASEEAADGAPVTQVEKIANPTIVDTTPPGGAAEGEQLPTDGDREEVSEALHSSITEEAEDVYSVYGVSKEKLDEIRKRHVTK